MNTIVTMGTIDTGAASLGPSEGECEGRRAAWAGGQRKASFPGEVQEVQFSGE